MVINKLKTLPQWTGCGSFTNAEFGSWFIAPNEIFPMWTTDAKHFKILVISCKARQQNCMLNARETPWTKIAHQSTPGGSVQNPWQGLVTGWAAYQIIWIKLLKKTNPGEAHKLIFKIPVKNVHDSVFLLLLWKQSKADS